MSPSQMKAMRVVNAVSETFNETLHAMDKKLVSHCNGIVVDWHTSVAAVCVINDMIKEIADKLDRQCIIDEAEFVRDCMKLPEQEEKPCSPRRHHRRVPEAD